MPKGLGFSEPRPSGQEQTLDLRDICPNQECCDGLVTTTKVRLTITKQPLARHGQRGGAENGGILRRRVFGYAGQCTRQVKGEMGGFHEVLICPGLYVKLMKPRRDKSAGRTSATDNVDGPHLGSGNPASLLGF